MKIKYKTFCWGTLLIALQKSKAVINPSKSAWDKLLYKMNNSLKIDLPKFHGIITNNQKHLATFCIKYKIAPIQIGDSNLIVLGYFNLFSKWLKIAEQGIISINKERYKSVKFKLKHQKYKQYKSKEFEVIISIPTKEGYYINLGAPTTNTKCRMEEVDFLFEFVGVKNLRELTSEYTDVEVPEFLIEGVNDLKVSPNNNITDNVRINGNNVDKSRQINRIRFTYKGVKVESLTEIRTKGIERINKYKFTDTFVVWVTHTEANNLSLFTAIADKETWTKN